MEDILVRLHRYVAPAMPKEGVSEYERAKEKQELENIFRQFTECEYAQATLTATSSMLRTVLAALPSTPQSSMTNQFAAIIPNIGIFVDRLTEPFFYKGTVRAEIYRNLNKQLWANVCIASGLPIARGETHTYPLASGRPLN